MKFLIVLAVFGLAAVALGQEEAADDCPEGFEDAFSAAKQHCMEQGKGSNGDGPDAAALMGQSENMHIVARALLRERRGAGKATPEQMKAFAQCLETQLQGNEFYEDVNAECTKETPEETEDADKERCKCMYIAISAKCPNVFGGHHGGKGGPHGPKTSQ